MSSAARRRFALIVGAALVAIGAGIAVSSWRLAPVAPANDAAAQFYAANLKDADGQAIDFKQFAGKHTVVNFWATWCAPCVEEMPEFDRVAKEVAPRQIKFVGIAIDSPSNMREFRQKVQVSYPLAAAGFGGAELAKAFGNATGGLPFTVLLAPNGEVVQRKLGRLKEEELRAWLAALR
jgi:thiol-disulfide isomerase/thioredoxin